VRETNSVTRLDLLLQHLLTTDVEFVVVGGFGAVVHGSSLVTQDLDVCVSMTPEVIEKLRTAFRELHPMHRISSPRRSFLDTPAPGTVVKNLYLQTDLGQLDVLGEILGVGDFSQVVRSSIVVEMFGHDVRVIELEALIRAKEALGRDKDLLAVKELRAILEKSRR
jgi:predicted nucleotidyltransferase